MPRRGVLIAVEGIDRCGKTTVVQQMSSRLRPLQVVDCHHVTTDMEDWLKQAEVREPLFTSDRSLYLLRAANRAEKQTQIRCALDDGQTVLVENYVHGAVARGAARGLDAQWCWGVEEGHIVPDHVIYLAMEPEIGTSRCGDAQLDLAMMRRVQYQYESMSGQSWHRIPVNKLSADLTMRSVFSTIMDAVNSHRSLLPRAAKSA